MNDNHHVISAYPIVQPIMDFNQTSKGYIINLYSNRIRMEMKKCKYGINYYTIIYYTVFIPVAITSGLIIPLISYLVAAGIFSGSTNRYLSLTVGMLAILVAFGHTAINYLEVDSKRNNYHLLYNMYQNKLHNLEPENNARYIEYNNIQLTSKLDKSLSKIKQNHYYKYPFFLEKKVDNNNTH